VWLTADGEAMLVHDGVLRVGVRRREIRRLSRAELPRHIPTLGELYDACGTSFELSLDLKDPDAVDRVLDVAMSAGERTLGRLWLCHHDWRLVAAWRSKSDNVKLVDSTRLRRVSEGAERRAAALAEAGVDAINLHHSEWSGGLTTLFHRFGVFAFGWDAQFPRVLAHLLDIGIDAVYSDHVDRMAEALRRGASGDPQGLG
jgi:glycerophosphoryl diester phosphodiesterase